MIPDLHPPRSWRRTLFAVGFTAAAIAGAGAAELIAGWVGRMP